MTMYDISMPIEEGMPVWPGDPAVQVKLLSSVDAGDEATVRLLRMSTHTGTHVDAPAHYLSGGSTVDQLPVDRCLGLATVVPLIDAQQIDAEDLAAALQPRPGMRVLLRTRICEFPGTNPPDFMDYAPLTLAAADWLVAHQIALVGVDTASVEALAGDGEVHRRLLSAGIVIVENLRLEEVPPGEYELTCLPLRIQDGDGAPARAILRTP